MIAIVDVTDGSGNVIEPGWLPRAEAVHRQLRPGLPADYVPRMERVFADGARMCMAVNGDGVAGVAVYRMYEVTSGGRTIYVDDLVTDETRRSQAVGHALMVHLQDVGRRAGCSSLTLDSGTHRQRAHKFYFREEMVIYSFHFSKPLK